MSFFEFPHTRTYDSDLGWLIKTVTQMINVVEELKDQSAEYQTMYDEIKAIYDKMVAGELSDGMIASLNKWFEKNAADLMGGMVKMIFFGLNDSGYFVAYIPEGWSDIIFNTSGYDYFKIDMDFGHLILSY